MIYDCLTIVIAAQRNDSYRLTVVTGCIPGIALLATCRQAYDEAMALSRKICDFERHNFEVPGQQCQPRRPIATHAARVCLQQSPSMHLSSLYGVHSCSPSG
jgi:hypothetical protein